MVKALLPILLSASAALLAPLGPIASAAPAGAAPAPALAIDCEAAASPNELLVCTDAELRRRDRLLAGFARDDAAIARLEWLRDERAHCDSVACLRTAYDAGIGEFRQAADAGAS